ncbi:MAG: 1-acyl-sn-glycerol-3-phosphate acyltransferase [Dehalococcoidia bacterium]|nr:1-acyl-sn-glycerol-3-phosphate acyltransferase [Dehalococcoidia bacterium]
MRRRFQRLLLGAHTRRMITVPTYVGLWLAGTLLLPIVIPIAAVTDIIARRNFAITRTMLQAYVYVSVEFVGLLVILYLGMNRWRYSKEEWHRKHVRLEGWWAQVQFTWAVRIFRLKLQVEGDDELAVGPYLLFIRHVSIVDNLIPAVFAVQRRNIALRWVLNWYLMRDPCIDIVGHRVGCTFVRGGTDHSQREIHRIREMADNLGPGEGVIIYPEGTLFSPSKQEKVVSRLVERSDAEVAEFARGLRNVLPPRLGGTIALLETHPDVDVVFCAHSGLEAALDKASILGGGLVGKELRIKFWRVPAAEIPKHRDELRRWLFDEWNKVDDFVTAGVDGASRDS